ncbi:MAG TPA: hypothetical protein VGC30_00085, partial [Dokdonella sp.]
VSEPFWPQRGLLANPRSRGSFDLQRVRALAANGRLAAARALLDELGGDPPPDARGGLAGDVASERARLDLAGGDAEAAAAAAQAAVAQLPTVDEAYERASAWLTLGRALRALGRGDDARAETDQFASWARERAALPQVALLAALAEAEQAWTERRRDEAYRAYAAALDVAERWSVPRDLATVAASYGNSLIADDELDRAGAVVGRVARWAEQDFDCALLQARLYRALGQTTAWQAALARARGLAGERPIPASAAAPRPARPDAAADGARVDDRLAAPARQRSLTQNERRANE